MEGISHSQESQPPSLGFPLYTDPTVVSLVYQKNGEGSHLLKEATAYSSFTLIPTWSLFPYEDTHKTCWSFPIEF